jgi:glycosyltransferase involved in cell wall biosynthesis
MKLAVLDPGYEHMHSHHHAVNVGIHNAFFQKNALVTFFGGYLLDQDTLKSAFGDGLDLVPYFTTPCYPLKAEQLPEHEHEVLAELFSREIIRLYTSGFLQGHEHLLIHTGYSFHVAGLAKAIWKIKSFKKEVRLVVSMMFHPGAKLSHNTCTNLTFFDRREYLRYKLALRFLHSSIRKVGIDVCLSTSCRAYQRVYQTLWPSESVVVHPALGYRPLTNKAQVKSTSREVLLYIGGAKLSKGIVFAAQLGAAAALAYPQATFVFHFNNEFPAARDFNQTLDILIEAGVQHKNISLLTGNLNQEKYDEVLNTSAIVCLLYDPTEYAFKTSGVFWDALRKGNCSWLVTENTWAQGELKDLGITHSVVKYGDINQGIYQIGELLAEKMPAADFSDFTYRDLLNSSFGDWLLRLLTNQTFSRASSFVTKINLDFKPNRGRILIVRTRYDHFSPFSGPGGFIPHLRALGYGVDELLVEMGSERIDHAPERLLIEFKRLTDMWVRSYQGNSIVAETDIQCQREDYDFIHFLDAEHCGLLSALFKQQAIIPFKAKLIATYHQPTSILNELIVDPSYLNGFDRIHLMSPSQAEFFLPYVDSSKLTVVPHGLAPELLEETLPLHLVAPKVESGIPELDAVIDKRLIILTVGNWLRDFKQLHATIKILQTRADLLFVVVSKSLQWDEGYVSNLLILNKGLTDTQLHALYLRASLLFLPLRDAAANNAILEALAHGLPIVTTDLQSTHFYTEGQASVCSNDAKSYAKAIESALLELKDPMKRSKKSSDLKKRGYSLKWELITGEMHERLYSSLVQVNAKGCK